MQRLSRENVQRVLDEQEKLSYELDSKKRKLELWSKELNKCETLTERDRQKLDDEMKKGNKYIAVKDLRDTQLQMASEEQRKSDENVLRLVEEQKREKEEALRKILELERDLNAKQKLELDIEELKGKLKVLQHMGDDVAVQKEIKGMNAELQDKIDDMKAMDELAETLIINERK